MYMSQDPPRAMTPLASFSIFPKRNENAYDKYLKIEMVQEK